MSNKIVAMILAGGKGTRLEALTKKVAKPAVSFAAKYHIIDFPISNCANSGINQIGVLTQYESTSLDKYIGNGEKWGLNGSRSLMTTLSPHQTEAGSNWYEGTADAITENIDFLDDLDPDYVLILSGDHIYKCTYNEMIDLHVSSKADATISVIEVDPKEASRFGIMAVDKNDVVTEFQEKPKKPKSNLASMGVYIFTWKVLRKFLIEDAKDQNSDHDFGKNIIPNMLNTGRKLQAYRFKGYWRDVGTLDSLHEANMDIALNRCSMDLFDDSTGRIYTEDTYSVAQYIGPQGSVKSSVVNQGAIVLGDIDTCVVSNEATIEQGASCKRCVIMSGAVVRTGARVENAIIGPKTIVSGDNNVGGKEIILLAGKEGL